MATEDEARAEEQAARLVDDSLVYLALANRGGEPLPKCFGSVITVSGVTYRRIIDMKHVAGFSRSNIASELPSDWTVSLLFNGERGNKYELLKGWRLHSTELRRQQSFGVVPADVKEIIKVAGAKISHDGEYVYTERSFRRTKMDDEYYDPTAVNRRKVVTRMSSNCSVGSVEVSSISPETYAAPIHCTTYAWALPRMWQIRLTLGPSPAVVWLVDATAVKELFQLRDRSEGRSRRAALLHWVSQHWRKDRHDPDAEVKVRKHLRGASSFKWFDLECSVVPSDLDTLAADKSRKDREADPETRRPNPRLKKLLGG